MTSSVDLPPAARHIPPFPSRERSRATWLTDAELVKLSTMPGVKAITADEPMTLDTATTPTYLGINQPGGAWSRTDAGGQAIKGENVIIGHVDGGVWPEDPSFSDRVDAQGKPVAPGSPGTLVYGPPPAAWNGVCQAGQGFTAANCNNKLIGARYFNATWNQAVALGLTRSWSGDYVDSPRDADGHGTHTLSTAGGNENVSVTVSGAQFTISGVAPRARVAAYKSCYVPADAQDNPQQGSCFQGDSVAAIEAAVADGVQVINFSISGSRTRVNDAVETAFAEASFAGVFVSASAGNSNVFPGNASTVAHVSPWIITVGNSTHNRYTVANVVLGSGASFNGPSFQTAGLPSKPLILATDAGVAPYASLSDADKLALGRCYISADGGSASARLDPAKVAGKIVVCYRGGNVLVNKAEAAATAGAAGMVLQNLPAGLLPAPFDGATSNTVLLQAYVLPTVHLPAANASAVVGYAAGTGATASFTASVQANPPPPNPVMSDSSSRGPNQYDLNVLKPDITAPGTDIIAAYTNESITPAQRQQIIDGTLVPGPGANMISGTSMSSPHVAGAAALLRQANPTWSPWAIKSALMTSGLQNVKLASGAADPSPWGYGAGHLNPNVALDTKVVYDSTINDFVLYYFGLIGGRQLNLASLTHANVVGVGSLTRTLTNKGTTPVTLNASGSIAGFDVTFQPATLTIPAGGSASYTVTLRRTSAPIEVWQFGDVTWSAAGGPALRSPLSAKASNIVAIADVTDTRAVGTKVYTIGFGYDGPLVSTGLGLLPATVFEGQVALDQSTCFPITVPTGARRLRVQLFNADTEGGAASDLDLTVLRGSTVVGSSGNGDSDELVTLVNPTASTYQACVDGFAPINGLARFKLSTWVLGPTNPNTMRVFGPSRVVTGGVASIGVSWSLPASKRYLGLVDYRQTAGGSIMGSTQVFIDAAGPTPAFATVIREKPIN